MEQLTVKEVADKLNMDIQALRAGLEQGVFPFGVAIKRSKWTYFIWKDKFERWLEC